MRILILTQYYPPETGAPQNRLSDLAQRLTKMGHRVTVLTALPNYPKGEIFQGYEGRWIIEEEDFHHIRIIRTWIYSTKKKAFMARLLNYFSFCLSSLLQGIWRVGSQDVLIVESPPLFLGITAYLMSVVKKAKLVFNVSDLWPESAVAMGMVHNRYLIRLSEALELFLYRQSALITGQTRGIVTSIQQRCPDKHVELITNGVDVARFVLHDPDAHSRRFIRQQFRLEQRYVVGYAGIHGHAQGLMTVLEAARCLASRPDIVFALFGDGPEKPQLVHAAEAMQLPNIRFFPVQSAPMMPQILSAFDAAVIPLRKLDLFKGALPSKMFEAMAAGIPLVAAVEGEAQVLVTKAKAGLTVEPEDPQAMAHAIQRLYENQDYGQVLGSNGQQYVIEYYNRQRIAEQFEQLLLALRYQETYTGKPAIRPGL